MPTEPSPTPATPAAAPPPSAGDPEPSLCPYCGEVVAVDAARCPCCKGLLDPLSKQATQNAMGPWFIRDEEQPFRPGCSYETLLALVRRGKIEPATILRGPTTGQFWRPARHVPGVGHLFGRCHACDHGVAPDASSCPRCRASFATPRDRQDLGLGPVHLLPGQQPAKPVPEARRPLAAPSTVPTPRPPAPASTIHGPRPMPHGVTGAPLAGKARVGGASTGPAAALATMASGGGSAPSETRTKSAQPQTVTTDSARRPARRSRPSKLAFVLAAVSLLVAVAVVMAAVFRTELTAFLGS
ncbi:MAG: hypothetical protein ACF8NJ_08940 [Phycisphaerales bacterium JB038]